MDEEFELIEKTERVIRHCITCKEYEMAGPKCKVKGKPIYAICDDWKYYHKTRNITIIITTYDICNWEVRE